MTRRPNISIKNSVYKAQLDNYFVDNKLETSLKTQKYKKMFYICIIARLSFIYNFCEALDNLLI